MKEIADRLPSPIERRQTTIARPATVKGIGFVSGADVTLTFLPAEANSGRVFVRQDLPDQPCIPVSINHVVTERRLRTALRSGDAVVEMTEHVLAALAGLDIDNCQIQIDGPETPAMDGSCLPFVDALLSAGIERLDAPKQTYVVEESINASAGDAMIGAHPGSPDRLDVTFNLDYSQNPGIGRQSLHVRITPETFVKEIAPARTFVLERDVAQLRAAGLGARSTYKDLLVFADDGHVIENLLRYPDECVRHKILDVIGDLALLGRPIHGHVLAHRSGHQLNAALVHKLADGEDAIAYERLVREKPLMDALQIQKILPHRFPFLLVDRVLLLDPNRRAVGIKNVSFNEPFFQGHWPNKPVMPGVLIVEAMAQLAGITLTEWQESGLYAMLVTLNGIKIRRPVTPGDQLLLEARTVRLKSRIATIETRALVGGEETAEAQMSFVLASEGEFDEIHRAA